MGVYSDYDLSSETALTKSAVDIEGSVAVLRDGKTSYQPSSVDLHLSDEFVTMDTQKRPIRVDEESTYPSYDHEVVEDTYAIGPNEMVLATTEETVILDDEVVGFLWGRSSVGRLGLFVHNSGLVDAGYVGEITLELYNASPNVIELKPGMRICQMTVHELRNNATSGYDAQGESKYQDQQGPTPSKLYEDWQDQSSERSRDAESISDEYEDFE